MLTPPALLPGLKASLERLQLDYVDVVFANRPDPNTPMEGRSASYPLAGPCRTKCSGQRWLGLWVGRGRPWPCQAEPGALISFCILAVFRASLVRSQQLVFCTVAAVGDSFFLFILVPLGGLSGLLLWGVSYYLEGSKHSGL